MRPPSRLGWLTLRGEPGRPTGVCEQRGWTALEIPKQRLLKRQGEPAGPQPCNVYHWTARPPSSRGALGREGSLGGVGTGAGCGAPGQEPHAPPLQGAGCPMTSLELEGVPGPCSPPLGLPQRRRPSASAPWLSPAFLGALKIHHFLKEPCVDSGARTRLWESLQSVNSSSVSGSRPRPGS